MKAILDLMWYYIFSTIPVTHCPMAGVKTRRHSASKLSEHSATNMKFRYEYDTNEYSWRKIFEYIRISEYSTLYDMKNMIRTNIRIYSDQKNDTNEYTNIFVSKKGYEYDTNENSWQKIFEYIRISEYSSHYVLDWSLRIR